MVFRREPLLHLVHLLKKETKVKEEGINLISITFILITLSMVNFHISIGKKNHVPFVVWLTILFLDVGRKWPLQETFEEKEARSQRSTRRGKLCCKEDEHVLRLLP